MPYSEEPPPPPVVYFRYTDDTLRKLVQRMRERTEELKEKAIDPYASSPEVSPPVSKYGRVHANRPTSNTQTWLTGCLTHASYCPLSASPEAGRLPQVAGREADSEGRGG